MVAPMQHGEPSVSERHHLAVLRTLDQAEEQLHPADLAQTLGTVLASVHLRQKRAVQDLRNLGWSWADIGSALGISAQSAWGRYHHLV